MRVSPMLQVAAMGGSATALNVPLLSAEDGIGDARRPPRADRTTALDGSKATDLAAPPSPVNALASLPAKYVAPVAFFSPARHRGRQCFVVVVTRRANHSCCARRARPLHPNVGRSP